MTKFLFQMVRLTLILSILFMMHSGYASSQNLKNTKVILNENNVNLVDIFNQISNITNFNFTYSSYIIEKEERFDVVYQKQSLEYVLTDLGKKAGFSYQVSGKDIMIAKQEVKTNFTESTFQQTTVNGTVLDAQGFPLPGASVIEKGTSNGVITNMDGEFEIKVKDELSVLIVSYFGYISKEIKVEEKTNFEIVLQEDRAKLDEIIVTGYTKERKSDLTGAVSVVNIKEFTSQPQANINGILEGRVSGVDVLNSNQPGGNSAIRVRGFSTIRNNDPLYVIDGVPTTTGINLINPNEIESLQILKDASSASIYGSRAANGVVLITTKKGESGEVEINYNGFVGIQTVNNLPEMANAEEYGLGLWEAFNNDGISPNNEIYGNGASPTIPEFLDSPENTIPSANTDWIDEIFDTALITSHDFSFSKGNEDSNLFFSLGYLKQEGNLKYTEFDRLNVRINSDLKIGDNIKVGENISLSNSNEVNAGTNSILGSPIYSAFRMPSITPVFDNNGNYTGYPINDIQNPVGQLFRNRNNEDETFRVFGNVFAEIKLLKGLKFKSNYGLNLSYFNSKDFNPTFEEPNTQRLEASLNRGEQNLIEWTFTNTLNYKKTFNEIHNFNALVGIESIESNLNTLSAFRRGFPGNEENFQVIDAGDAGTQENSGNKVETSLLSYFGKVNYSYDNRYLFSYTIRRDGTSKLLNNKWGTFSAASFGWKVSNENFFNSEIVNNLKLRLGWGQNGNQDIPAYVTQNGFSSDPQNTNFPIDGSQNSAFNGVTLSRNSNPDLRWETTEQYNLGVDFGIFNNRLNLSAEYFYKTTEDLLLERNLTPAAGGTNSTIWDNVGEMTNKGFELSLNYSNDVVREFNYNLNLNLSAIENELTSLKEGVDFIGISTQSLRSNNFDQEVTRTAESQPIASFFGWQVDGIFQNQSEVDAHATQSDDTAPGDFRFRDINNDGVINDEDRTFIGSPHPDLTLGFNMEFAYKNFDLNAFFRASIGNDIYNLTKYYTDFYNLSNYNKSPRVLNAWSPSNTSSSLSRLSINDPNNNIRPSSYYVSDGDFLRLQTLQLGYNLPMEILEEISLRNLRIYLNFQNVLTLTNYEGFDPEVGLQNYNSGDRNLDIGVDRGIYPPATIFQIGLNLTF